MRSPRFFATVLVLCFSGISPRTALAQLAAEDTKPEKDQYWLLDPTPENELRSFSTDRPPKSNSPYTVDAGHFQYETDLISFAHQQTGSVRIDTLQSPNPTFKVGLTNDADFEVNIAPYVNVRTFDLRTGMGRDVSGAGDLFTRLKVNLWGDDGGNSAFALISYVKAPTAPAGIGNGAVEGGVIAPLSLSLPDKFTLLLNWEADAFRDDTGRGYHSNFAALINLSRTIVKDVTFDVELWSDFNGDPAKSVRQYSFDTAITWIIKPNLQADIGTNIGLNSMTPAFQVYLGLSQRF
jgi:Putative MetA-pathway of phenol degradation